MGYTPNHLGHVNIYVRNGEEAHKAKKPINGMRTYSAFTLTTSFRAAPPLCRPIWTSPTR